MDYYCEVCLEHIKARSKYKHFKPNIHNELNRCKHKEITVQNPNINDIDELFYSYIIEHNKKN